mgnify:FL=1
MIPIPETNGFIEILKPQQIVEELDKHIIGQRSAKVALAIALRNRWRRMQLSEEMQAEIQPKNILMIGPTGVGKTELARKLAKLAKAPFIKVDATKFTEVGYVGRDVESIVRDLVEAAFRLVRAEKVREADALIIELAEERILDALIPGSQAMEQGEGQESSSRQVFRKKLREGALDEKEIEVELSNTALGVEIMAPPGLEEMTSQLQQMFSSTNFGKPRKAKMSVARAFEKIKDEEATKLLDEEQTKQQALKITEQTGIVFIDELDKVAQSNESHNAGISREGVQRDLLPLIEGCSVSTKYGVVRTDHILFIASGAFHLAKPSDLAPELQGRLPVRVELSSLGEQEFERILTEPKNSLCRQYEQLLAVEGVKVEFKPCGVKRIAALAQDFNNQIENIGARRLHTIMEKLLESISFDCVEENGNVLEIDSHYVDEQLEDISKKDDLSRFIL